MGSYDNQNIFARILRGDVPVRGTLYDDEYALAFPDLFPKAPVHILVIPKGPYVNYHAFYGQADPKEILGFSKAVITVIQTLGLEQNGYRLISNCGSLGGQEVPHFHVHILSGCPLGPLVSRPSEGEKEH